MKHYTKAGTAMAALSVAATLGAASAVADQPLRIGLAAPLTGSYAPYSEAQGVACMADMINKKESGPKIEVTIEDSRSDAQQTVAIGQKLLDAKNVIVAGTPFPDSLIPLTKLAEAAGAMVFSAQITQVDMQKAGFKNFLQMAVPDDINASASAEVLAKKGAKTAVLLTSQDSGSWSASTPEWFGQAFEKFGGKVVGRLNYSLNTSDWSPQITQIKALSTVPDVVYVCSAVPDVGILSRQLHAAGFKGWTVGCDGFDDPSLEGTVGSKEALSQTMFATWATVGLGDGPGDKFIASCKAAGYKMNGITDVSGGDLVRIAWQAAKDAGTTTDAAAILKAIRSKPKFENVMIAGEMTFAEGRVYPKRAVPVIGFVDGKRSIIDRVDPSFIPASQK